jgi:L-amino acid N-acyltransferase YncA
MKEDTKAITIRIASPNDAEQLLRIYAPYVTNSVTTFEYEVPTIEAFRHRVSTILETHPYLVAEAGNKEIVGYAYATTFKSRKAYDWSAESSIYLDPTHQHLKIGAMLYQALEDCLKRQNVTNLNACITFAETEDALHNNNSLSFHHKMGFKKVAHFHKCGYKFDRWWDMVWMEKHIAAHHIPQPDFIPFQSLL